MLLSIAARNLVRQRTRTLLTLATVGFGVVGLILARGFVDDVLWQLREATIHSQLGHFQVFAPGYIDGARRDPLAHLIARPADAVATLRALPGVDTVARRLSFSGSLSNGRGQVAVLIDGVEPSAEARIGTALRIVVGVPLERASGASMIVGEGVAHSLGLRPGDTVTLLAATREGALNTLDVSLAGVFRSPFKDYDAAAVMIKLNDAQALVGVESVNSLTVLLAPDVPVEPALTAARHALPSDDYDIRGWRELADFYQGTAALYHREFLVLLLIVSLMVVLSVSNSIGMSLHERRSEFGTVRALGYPPSAVFREIIVESALLGAAAALLGIAVGALLAGAISWVGISMPPPPNSEFGYVAAIRLSAASLALAALVGFTASIAGAILPARRLARMSIVEALRHAA